MQRGVIETMGVRVDLVRQNPIWHLGSASCGTGTSQVCELPIEDLSLAGSNTALIGKLMLALMRAVTGLFEFRGRCFQVIDLRGSPGRPAGERSPRQRPTARSAVP